MSREARNPSYKRRPLKTGLGMENLDTHILGFFTWLEALQPSGNVLIEMTMKRVEIEKSTRESCKTVATGTGVDTIHTDADETDISATNISITTECDKVEAHKKQTFMLFHIGTTYRGAGGRFPVLEIRDPLGGITDCVVGTGTPESDDDELVTPVDNNIALSLLPHVWDQINTAARRMKYDPWSKIYQDIS